MGALAVPALFFVLLEGGLRVGGYGVNTDLVLELDGETPTCYLNGDVATRYFSPALRSIQPSIGFRTFEKKKAPGALRVFVLGESTTAGFPFHVNGSFAGFLEDDLRATYTDRHIEVINVGMSAISSYVVLDFAKQLVHYEPDLFLVYTGHNEFYGALGAASTRAASSRPATLLEMKLANLRTYQLVCNTIFRVRSNPAEHPAAGRSLMAAMIGERTIRMDSPIHTQAEQVFRANLTDLIEVAKAHHVPVIVSTVTSNLRDLPPFDSAHAPGLDAARARSIDAALTTTDRDAIGHAVALDTTYAASHYSLARALEGDSALSTARAEYVRARDHDVVHFRACSVFNDIIREVAAAHHVPVLEMDAVFSAHAQGHVPGLDLFLEHLHPNLRGAMLMAAAFLDAMQTHGVVPREQKPERSYEQALKDACITPLDLELARQRIVSMTTQWPFTRSFGNGPDFPKSPPAVSIMARHVLERRIDLAAAHEAMGREYLAEKDLARALDEFIALAKIYPISPAGPINTADILLQLKRPAESIAWYRRGLELDPGATETHFHLAMAYEAAGRAGDAVEACKRVLALDPTHVAARRLLRHLDSNEVTKQ